MAKNNSSYLKNNYKRGTYTQEKKKNRPIHDKQPGLVSIESALIDLIDHFF